MLIYDDTQKERFRIEGYLPREEFRGQLALARARVSFMHKKFAEAETLYHQAAQEYASTAAAPEAIYWSSVCHYKATNDHTVLADLPSQLAKYPDSIWTKKAIPFGSPKEEKVA